MKNILFISLLLFSKQCLSDMWIPKANFGGPNRADAVGCAINGKGYLGTGYTTGYSKDWWEYDTLTNAWTQKADFMGNSNVEGTCIGIIGKVYFLPFSNGNNFYMYDPLTNTWTMKATFPGLQRQGAIGFTIDNKGYFGLGGVNSPNPHKNDLWEYDPATDSWNQKADLPAAARMFAAAFSIGSKGYIGTGSSSSGTLSDFWEYDAISDTWTQKSSFPGGQRYEGNAFSVGGFGFMGGGYGPLPRNDFWRYDPQTDSWTPIALLPHNGVVETVCFSIGNYAYLGTGWDGTNFMNNFWQYSADSIVLSTHEISENNSEIMVYPNPAKNFIIIKCNDFTKSLKVTLTDSQGRAVFKNDNYFPNDKINLMSYPAGCYFATIENNSLKTVSTVAVIK